MAKSVTDMNSGEILIFNDLSDKVAGIVLEQGKRFGVIESTSDLRDIINKFEAGYKQQVDAMAKTIEILKDRLRKIENGEFKSK